MSKRMRELGPEPTAKDMKEIPLFDGVKNPVYYRPVKTPVTVRLDADILAWLKAKGTGHLTRINTILRREMLAEGKR